MGKVRRSRRPGGRYPQATVMGRKLSRDAPDDSYEHPAVTIAVDRWISRRHCHGCQFCDQYARVSRLRAAYGRRRR